MKLVVLASGPDNVKALVGHLRRELLLEPALWLGKPSLDNWVREAVPTCRVLSYSRLESGDPLAGRKIGPGAVSLTDRFLAAQTSPFKKDAILAEFSRLNRWRFLRPIDREIQFRQLALFFAQELLECEPEGLYSSETPHNPFALLLFELAEFLGLKTLFFQPATALAPALIPMTSLNELSVKRKGPFNNPEATGFLRKVAQESIVQLQQGKSTRLQRHSQSSMGSNALQFNAQVVPRTVERLRRWRKQGFSRELLNFGVNMRSSLDLASAYSRLKTSPSPGTHALFALHYQPERTTVPEGGYRWCMQADAVLAARDLLPDHLRLVVKEHKGQVAEGRRGYMARNAAYYNLIQALPSTELLSGEIPSSAHIEAAEIIFTLTGSVGIEGVLKGIPVIHFGLPWWSGVPGSIFFPQVDGFGKTINKLRQQLDPSSAQKFLERRVVEEGIPGFGSPSQELFWRTHLSVPTEFNQWATSALLSVVEERFSRPQNI